MTKVLLEEEGFSLGVSTRGMGMRGRWYRWPFLRFLPPLNGGPWSDDRLALERCNLSSLWPVASVLTSNFEVRTFSL